MLIEFSVANFRSFREKQTFSLVKAKGNELEETNTFRIQSPTRFDLLRSAAVYGPNASGKSNFIRALRVMRRIVVDSASWQRGEDIPVVPFRLDARTANSRSEFEVVFLADDIRYQYGFSADKERIYEEWLIAYPKGRAQRWFQRAWEDERQSSAWETGKQLQGEKQVWQRSTRENALFLSTAVQLNSRQLQPVYDWFSENLRIVNIEGLDPAFTAALCRTKEKSRIIDFLKAADLSINDVEVQRISFDPQLLPADIPESLKEMILSEMVDKNMLEVSTFHRLGSDELVQFDLEDESDGTRKLFSFAGPWVDTLNKGFILFIDELHDNLHPKLVRFLVDLFHSRKSNPKNAQLVFTTHETSILSQEVFRRDQIWFCEKDEDETTHLYPLTDFSPRKGRENLEAAYLSGRYGALPFVGEMAEM